MSVSQDDLIAVAEDLGKIAVAIAAGDYVAAAESAFDAALKLIPENEQSTYLTAAAIRRQQMLKDAADAAKFGSGT